MAKKTGYLGNVAKEAKQTAKKVSNAIDKGLNGNRPLPKGMKIGPSNIKAEAGQLAGAVLQGRRYDAKGKQITASAKSKGSAMAKRAAAPKLKKTASGPKSSRTEVVKQVRILGGTGYSTERTSDAMKRVTSIGQSATPRKKKAK